MVVYTVRVTQHEGRSREAPYSTRRMYAAFFYLGTTRYTSIRRSRLGGRARERLRIG